MWNVEHLCAGSLNKSCLHKGANHNLQFGICDLHVAKQIISDDVCITKPEEV